METKRTPMHIGALMTFELPPNAPPDFLHRLIADFSELSFLPPPFDCRLADSSLSAVAPAWIRAEPDPEYHVRHSALPSPGGERELGRLVARLHSNQLDFERPLWEAHVIEGLAGNRFAFYFKAHHCAIDGMGAVQTIKRWLSADPDDLTAPALAPGQCGAPTRDRSTLERARDALGEIKHGTLAVPELIGKLGAMATGTNSMVRTALDTPRTVFNARITQQRRLATQLVELDRLKTIGRATDATVNDVTLALCGAAVRRYLLEHEGLPEKSVTASVPIGLPRSESAANAAAGFVCPIGTDQSDPRRRLELIKAASARGKRDILSLSPSASQHFTLLGLLPLALGQMTGTLARTPPYFNFTVSNLVLAQRPLYLRGARLESIYPMSFLVDGYGLNVTLVGYADKIAFGFLGCRDLIPHLQHLAVYVEEALTELETAAGIVTPTRRPKVAARRRPTPAQAERPR
jgi:WS/DGAT/MGAT family acyltransferase